MNGNCNISWHSSSEDVRTAFQWTSVILGKSPLAVPAIARSDDGDWVEASAGTPCVGCGDHRDFYWVRNNNIPIFHNALTAH